MEVKKRIKLVIEYMQVDCVEELTQFTEYELMEHRNIGIYAVKAVKEALAEKGLKLKQ